MVITAKKDDITEKIQSVIPTNNQENNTIKFTDLSKELQELLREVKKNFNCPHCQEEFTRENWFDNCVSDPQDFIEHCHCFNCGYDSREEKEKEEVPF